MAPWPPSHRSIPLRSARSHVIGDSHRDDEDVGHGPVPQHPEHAEQPAPGGVREPQRSRGLLQEEDEGLAAPQHLLDVLGRDWEFWELPAPPRALQRDFSAQSAPTTSSTAPGRPSSWSLHVCAIPEGRKIPPRRWSRDLEREGEGRTPWATSAFPWILWEHPTPPPYRRRGLVRAPTVTLGTPIPWERSTKDRSSPST